MGGSNSGPMALKSAACHQKMTSRNSITGSRQSPGSPGSDLWPAAGNPPWLHLAPFGVHLVPFGVHLAPLGVHLGVFGVPLGLLGPLGGSLGCLGAYSSFLPKKGLQFRADGSQVRSLPSKMDLPEFIPGSRQSGGNATWPAARNPPSSRRGLG